jgi:hypothetical protein
MKNTFLKASLVGLIMFASGIVNMANSSVILSIDEVGNDVVMKAVGSFDMAGLQYHGSNCCAVSNINGSGQSFTVGDNQPLHYWDVWKGMTTSGTSVLYVNGATPHTVADSATGELWGLINNGFWMHTYGGKYGLTDTVTLNSSATFLNHTLATLNLKENSMKSYTWNGKAQIIIKTENVSANLVNAPSTLATFALGLMGLASRRFMKNS